MHTYKQGQFCHKSTTKNIKNKHQNTIFGLCSKGCLLFLAGIATHGVVRQLYNSIKLEFVVLFYLPGCKAVYSALSSAACNLVNISMWQVNDGGECWRLQRNNAQQKKNTAYYSAKGILSRDLDKASHIIMPVVSDCNPLQVSV